MEKSIRQMAHKTLNNNLDILFAKLKIKLIC